MAGATRGAELVGRDEELAQIEAFLHQASVEPVSMLLEGPPGIGKSAVWEEGVCRARDRGIRVLDARPAEAERGLPFAGLTDLLATTHDTIGELPSVKRRALRLALLLVDGRGASPDIRVVGMAYLALLQRLAEEQPVVVAIDDAQWLDSSSALVVEFALRRIEQERVSAFIARRPDGGGLRVVSAVSRVLKPLRRSALEVVIARQAPTLELALIRRIGETANGNPLFALEIARALVAAGGEIALGAPLPVPDDVRQLIATRIAALDQAEQELLLRLAGASRAFGERIQERGVDPKQALLAGIVVVDGRALRFAHPLYAAAVYAAASPARLRRVHAELAALIDDPEEHARHLALAEPGPDRGVAKALSRAAAAAEARGAAPAAAELAEHALEATPPDDRKLRLQRMLVAGRLLFEAGSASRSIRVLSDALRDARAGTERARVLRQLGLLRGEMEGTRTAIELYARALEESIDDDVLRGSIEQTLAWNLTLEEGPQAGRPHVTRALEIAERSGDSTLLAAALGTLYELEMVDGREAQDVIERALEAEQRADWLFLDESPSLIYARNLAFRLDRFDEARRIFERLQERADSMGRLAINGLWYHRAELEQRACSWTHAIAVAEEGLTFMGKISRGTSVAALLCVRAWARAHLGHIELARDDAALATSLAQEFGPAAIGVALAQGALAFAELSVGNLAEAAAASELAMNSGTSRLVSVGMANYVEALVRLGRSGEAAQLLRESAMPAATGRRTVLAGLRAKAWIAQGLGDNRGALAAVAEGLEYEATAPYPFERARLLLFAGGIHRRERRKAVAADALTEAVEIFQELDAAVWAESARRELARVGGRPAHGGKLSETEQRIAALVAQGRSNSDVAHELVMSSKTVEWNLSKIYKKLHVTSRTELAAKLAKR